MIKRLGWNIMLGISNSTITNGLWADDNTLSADIEVFVPELTPNAMGKPYDSPLSENITMTNPLTGEKTGVTVPRIQTIKCQYMGGQNLIVPCIHKGEQVWVLQYEGGELSYYWLPIGRDEGIRLHEHIRWYASNQPQSISDGKPACVEDSNSYFVDINTNKGQKSIHVHTSVNDGEPVGYDIRIMPEKEWLEIIDTKGNFLHLDSLNTIWKMWNINDSYLELNKTDITIHCLHDLKIIVGNDMTTTVGNDQTSTIGNNKTTTVGKDTVFTSGQNITTTATDGTMTDIAPTVIRTASSLMQDNSPVYNNLAAAVAFTGGAFSVTGANATIASLNVDIAGLARMGITGPFIEILNLHGTINGLGGW